MKQVKDGYLWNDVKRNLLGCLETALFMPVARTRFGDTREDAARSFLVPLLMFPLSLTALWLSPHADRLADSATMMALLYVLRMFIGWAVFFGAVYKIASLIDRKKHFYQFVTASNWLTVPATAVFLPVIWMLLTGAHSWQELYPFMTCLMIYTGAFTVFMAAYVLRVPWEMAGFIVAVGMIVNDSTLNLVGWCGTHLLS